jgi:hypothetical protein
LTPHKKQISFPVTFPIHLPHQLKIKILNFSSFAAFYIKVLLN